MMNKILFFSLLGFVLLLSPNILAQNKADALPQDTTLKYPQITFVNTTYDFGMIRKGDKFVTSFYFKNTGTQPLQLLQVQTSCGCTASDWPTEAIAPNATSEITVTFDSNAKGDLLGKQNKILLVISNAVNKEEKLYLKGEVVKVE